MSPDEKAAVLGIARLRGEIVADREAMRQCFGEACGVITTWGEQPPERPYLVVGAVALHGWYTGLEAVLERVARQLDGEVPTGDRWHQALVSQAMVELPGLRPAVLPRSLEPDLRALLGFRHFFRHAYALNLDPAKLKIEVERLRRVAPLVSKALDAFDTFLQRAFDSIMSGG